MFDKIEYKSETRVVAVTKQIEKTITPDKVTEMYDKVRDQVERDIVSCYQIESNQLMGIAVVVNDEYNTMSKRVIVRYSLNGKEYITTGLILSSVDQKEAVFDLIYDHFKSEVAKAFMRESLQFTTLFSRGL